MIVEEESRGDVEGDEDIDRVMLVCGENEEYCKDVEDPTYGVQHWNASGSIWTWRKTSLFHTQFNEHMRYIVSSTRRYVRESWYLKTEGTATERRRRTIHNFEVIHLFRRSKWPQSKWPIAHKINRASSYIVSSDLIVSNVIIYRLHIERHWQTLAVDENWHDVV